MRRRTQIFDNISAILFIFGMITSRLRSLSSALFSAIFNVTSLLAYLIGYVAWYIAAYLHPEYPRKQNEWYGFAEFKDQHQMAAILGTLATIMCIITPTLIIPITWIYTFSNLMWTIGEHHKIQNPPPEDENYSRAKQSSYFRYSALITSNSFLVAIASTIAFYFPPISFAVLMVSTIIGAGLTIAALYYAGQSAFGHYPPDKIGHSYKKLSKELSSEPGEARQPTMTSMHHQEHQKPFYLMIKPKKDQRLDHSVTQSHQLPSLAVQ